jgi:hypothetical protein
MFKPQSIFSRKVAVTVAGALALALGCAGAFAQPGPGTMDPAVRAKVWEAQAMSVAQSLALDADQAKKLVAAYQAARESHTKAMMAQMKPGERPDFGALREVNQAEKAKFETAIKAFLNPEQTTKALTTLGAFSRRWDPMTEAIVDMKLDEKVQAEAMKVCADYVAESDKLMQAAAASNDMQAIRGQMAPLREKLDAAMAKILSADQMTKWKEATAMRRGGRGMGSRAPAPAPAPAQPAPAK